MEICDQRIDNFEIKRRIDKNLRLAGARDDFTVVLLRDTFEHAKRRRTNSDDAFAGINQFNGFSTNVEPFLVHDVLVEMIGFDRRKCSESDMQRDKTNLHPARANFIQ